MPPAPTQKRLPTLPEIKTNLDGLLSLVLVNFAKLGVHPLMAKEIGCILAKLDLSTKCEPADWSKMLDDSATHLLEEITLAELRSSLN